MKRSVVMRMTEDDARPRFFVHGTDIELVGVQHAEMKWDGINESYATGKVTFLVLGGSLLEFVRDFRYDEDTVVSDPLAEKMDAWAADRLFPLLTDAMRARTKSASEQ